MFLAQEASTTYALPHVDDTANIIWGWSNTSVSKFCGSYNYEIQDAGSGGLLTYNETSHNLTYSLPSGQNSYTAQFTAIIVVTMRDWPTVPSIDLLVPVLVVKPVVP